MDDEAFTVKQLIGTLQAFPPDWKVWMFVEEYEVPAEKIRVRTNRTDGAAIIVLDHQRASDGP